MNEKFDYISFDELPESVQECEKQQLLWLGRTIFRVLVNKKLNNLINIIRLHTKDDKVVQAWIHEQERLFTDIDNFLGDNIYSISSNIECYDYEYYNEKLKDAHGVEFDISQKEAEALFQTTLAIRDYYNAVYSLFEFTLSSVDITKLKRIYTNIWKNDFKDQVIFQAGFYIIELPAYRERSNTL